MEYFEGILFLTTNRFEVMDRAFKSRIHLAISYPPLPTDSRKQLWRNLLTRACDGRLPRWATERLFKKLASSDVNGREIKNIVRMAHGLARDGKREMRSEDVFKGIRALELFDKDIRGSQSKVRDEENQPCERNDRHVRAVPRRDRGFLTSFAGRWNFFGYMS